MDRLRLLRHRARTEAIAWDIYLMYLRLSPRWRASAVWPDTEIVIEGYPRSGNTFAQVAFEMAQGRPVRIAHHTHAPAQVRWAARHGIPTVLLIRRAEDAVISHVIRDPYIPLGLALSDWLSFYGSLTPLRNQVVVAEFHRATADFGAVVRRLNDMYKTSFEIFDSTEENVRRCFSAIDDLHRKHRKRWSIDEARVARPSAARSPASTELKATLQGEEFAPSLKRAQELYGEFLDADAAVF